MYGLKPFYQTSSKCGVTSIRKEDGISKGEINKRSICYFSLVKIEDLSLVWIRHVTLFLIK